MQRKRSYRIRHCDGNRSAWLLNALQEDGSEAQSYGSYTTSHSLDTLLDHPRNLHPLVGETVYVPAREGEETARTIRQAWPGVRVIIEHRAQTELTPIGEQYVIPGCETHERAAGAQLKLWEG